MEKEREEKLDLDEKVELISDSDLDDKVGGSAVDDVIAIIRPPDPR